MTQADARDSTNVVQFQPKALAVPEASNEDVSRMLLAVILRTMSAKHRNRAAQYLAIAEDTDNVAHRAVIHRARAILGA